MTLEQGLDRGEGMSPVEKSEGRAFWEEETARTQALRQRVCMVYLRNSKEAAAE